MRGLNNRSRRAKINSIFFFYFNLYIFKKIFNVLDFDGDGLISNEEAIDLDFNVKLKLCLFTYNYYNYISNILIKALGANSRPNRRDRSIA